MIDLHTHTTASDGTDTPTELLRSAAGARLIALAVTDHDTVDGLDEARRAGSEHRVEVISGVELSVRTDLGILHILGYFVDPAEPELRKALAELRRSRDERTSGILAKLAEIGIDLTEEDVAAETSGGVPGRPHIARALIGKKRVSTIQEAFDRYLGKDKPAYVEKFKFAPDRALELIRGAGGVGVMAHPYSVLEGGGRDYLSSVTAMLKEHGLAGIEVYYPRHNHRQVGMFLELTRTYDLCVTGGTDYHGRNKPGVGLGEIPGYSPLPYSIVEDLRERLNHR